MERKYTDLSSDPAVQKELEECDRVYKNICKSIMKQPGYVVDWQLVDKAWDTAVEYHRDTRRLSGELYLCHPRTVMEELAKLRCKSSVLAAALLHDTMEDCGLTYEMLRENFSYEVAQIVDAVTAIKAEEKEADSHFSSMSKDEQHAFLDRLTDAKLIASPFQREAFLVRFADRVHNLSTIGACKPGKRMEKIISTRSFLIPAARELGMRYFEVVLSDYCLRYDGEDYQHNESVQLLENRKALTRVSGGAYSRFDQLLEDAVADQKAFSFPCFNPYVKLRGSSRDGTDEMLVSPRRVLLAYELQQQMHGATTFERSRLDLWEIILTCQDKDSHSMLEHFLDMYRAHLRPEGIFFEYIGQDKGTIAVRLTDRYENNYRIVLVPEAALEEYFIGSPDGDRLTMIDEEAPGDALRPQITVYSYSQKRGYRKYSKCIPYGASALDFAFIINPALAVTCNYARIHKWNPDNQIPFGKNDYNYPLRTILSDGDIVNFDADYYPRKHGDIAADSEGLESIPHATIDWFADVNTECGKNCLIKYFKSKISGKE